MVCPECGKPTLAVRRKQLESLAKSLPSTAIAPRKPDPSELLVIVFVSDDGPLMRVLKDHLSIRGITVHQVLPARLGGYGGQMGSHKLLVFNGDEGLARQVIAGLMRGVATDSDAGVCYLQERAEKGRHVDAKALLDKILNVPPVPGDELPD